MVAAVHANVTAQREWYEQADLPWVSPPFALASPSEQANALEDPVSQPEVKAGKNAKRRAQYARAAAKGVPGTCPLTDNAEPRQKADSPKSTISPAALLKTVLIRWLSVLRNNGDTTKTSTRLAELAIWLSQCLNEFACRVQDALDHPWTSIYYHYRRQSLLLWFKLEDLWLYSEELWYELANRWHGLCFVVLRYRIRLFSRIRLALYRFATWAFFWPKILYFDIYQAIDNALCCSWDICAGLYDIATYHMARIMCYFRWSYSRVEHYISRLVFHRRCISLIMDRLTTASAQISITILVSMWRLLVGVSNERHDTDQAVTQHCQLCAVHRQSRQYNGQSTGLSTHFRVALARLLETRLNPRAIPFTPAPSMRRNRWHYVVDPATKHLCLPVTNIAAPHKRARPAQRRSIEMHCKVAWQRSPANKAHRKSSSTSSTRLSNGQVVSPSQLSMVRNQEVRFVPGRNKAYRKRRLVKSQGRHRRHRRHRKHAMRGLPTPASSLYSTPRAPPPALRHEGIAHDLEDHG